MVIFSPPDMQSRLGQACLRWPLLGTAVFKGLCACLAFDEAAINSSITEAKATMLSQIRSQ